ncbi:MAG TPA: hypothetical protein VGL61_25190 [Kofleriaceae bacterium]
MRWLLLVTVLGACSIPGKNRISAGGGGDDDGGMTSTGDDGGTGGGDDGGITGESDASPPPPLVLELTSQPPQMGNQPDVTFGFAANQPADLQCRIDAQPFVSCPGPTQDFKGLPDGAHSFDLQGTAGAQMASIPTYNFSISTVGPELALTSYPDPEWKSRTVTFAFTIGDAVPATVMCQVDSGNAEACTSPFTTTLPQDGSHSFILSAQDSLGNPSTTSYTWTIDTVAPTLTITQRDLYTPPFPSYTTNKQPVFYFSTNDPTAATTCKVDSNNPFACTTGVTLGPLTDGTHTFSVFATDPAGNQNEASNTWGQDTVGPSITSFVADCTGGAPNAYATWTATDAVSGVASCTCGYGGGGTTSCTTGGWHGEGIAGTLSVYCTDNAGNKGPTKTQNFVTLCNLQ